MADNDSQQADEFETPTPEQIVAFTGQHIEMLEGSNDDSVWILAGMPHVLITQKGRTSGAVRKTPLPYWRDPNGHRVVVGSFAGAVNHPAWFHNLADTSANPTIRVQDQATIYDCVVDILDGDDYTATWAALTADRPFYADYQANTERQIPLIRLPEPTS